MKCPLLSRAVVAPLAVLTLGACGAGPAPTGPDAFDGLREAPPATQRTVSSPTLTLRVLRVKAATGGGGDAILVADSGGVRPWHALLDAGDGAAAAYLGQAGIDTLDLMVLTHAHHDHYAGLATVLRSVHVRRFAYNGQVRTASTYESLMTTVRTQADTVATVRDPWILSMPGGGRTILLPPLDTWTGSDTDDGEEINDGSLGVRVEVGGFSFLTTGDGEFKANEHFRTAFPDWVDVDVFKVGHHGSTDATTAGWLDVVSPEVSIVSANGVSHPHSGTLALLRARGADLYCTPQHGVVTLFVDGAGDYAVRTAEDARARCTAGSEAG